jgi:hypothetical protein
MWGSSDAERDGENDAWRGRPDRDRWDDPDERDYRRAYEEEVDRLERQKREEDEREQQEADRQQRDEERKKEEEEAWFLLGQSSADSSSSAGYHPSARPTSTQPKKHNSMSGCCSFLFIVWFVGGAILWFARLFLEK